MLTPALHHISEGYNTFQVGLSPEGPRPPWGNISRWQMGEKPLWLNFSNPTILNINQGKKWDNPALSDLAVVDEQNAITKDSWIYLLITATKFPYGVKDRSFAPAFHPVSSFSFHTIFHSHLSHLDPPSWSRLCYSSPVKKPVLEWACRHEIRQPAP